jgi:hypothetical protein
MRWKFTIHKVLFAELQYYLSHSQQSKIVKRYIASSNEPTDAHREGEGGYETAHPPSKFLKNLLIKMQ